MAMLAKLREGCPRVRAGVRVGRQGSGAAKYSHAMRGILAEPWGRQGAGWLEG